MGIRSSSVDRSSTTDRSGENPTADGHTGLTRRNALRLGGVAGAVLLAGCTRDLGEEFPPNTQWPTAELRPELPVRERTDVLEERIDAMADAEIESVTDFATAFGEYAFEVETVEEVSNVLSIEYVNTKFYEEGKFHDIAPIAGAYAALVEHGYGAVALSITILDAAPASFGSAAVETVWAEQFVAGDLTTGEYGQLVASTIESKRHPPEVGVTPAE